VIANPLNSSPLAFPILEVVHIVGFISAVGSAALVDFRLLGFILPRRSPAEIWRATLLWTIVGLTLVVFSGLSLFSSDPDMYYLNPAFDLKIAVMIAAIVFYYTAVRKAVAKAVQTGASRLVAWISLLLWVLVLFGGIFIAFVQSYAPEA